MAERVRVRSGSPYEDTVGFSRAVRVGDRVMVAGTAPVLPDGSCPPDAAGQAERCFEIVLAALARAGAAPADVVRTRMFLTDAADADAVGRVHRRVMADALPAATMVVVAGLLRPEWKVELEAEAIVDEIDVIIDEAEAEAVVVEAEAVIDEAATAIEEAAEVEGPTGQALLD